MAVKHSYLNIYVTDYGFANDKAALKRKWHDGFERESKIKSNFPLMHSNPTVYQLLPSLCSGPAYISGDASLLDNHPSFYYEP